jgi:hypothetical protein
LYKKDIIAALKYYVFDRVTITEDAVGHMKGPAVSLVAEMAGQV